MTIEAVAGFYRCVQDDAELAEQLERGPQPPTPERLERLARERGFDCSAAELALVARVLRFWCRVHDDASLQAALEQAMATESPQAAAAEVARVAADLGCDVDPDALSQVTRLFAVEGLADAELGDAELEQVAGGVQQMSPLFALPRRLRQARVLLGPDALNP